MGGVKASPKRAACAWLIVVSLSAAMAADEFGRRRERMVAEQIQERGIKNPRLLLAMREVPRHLFVPAELQGMAYLDQPLAIGYDATISQPYIVALMTELLEPAQDHRALEIGTGSGYQAAVLSKLVKHVYSVEIVPQLAQSASENLKRLGYGNVTVRQGDGYKGWPEQAPFDRIILTAAPPRIPDALLAQLANGGRLIAPVGATAFDQELVLIEKARDGSISRKRAGGVRFVPMKKG
jgi:protein-L-isoaspartate(D-aspartate) O-methyltransferase